MSREEEVMEIPTLKGEYRKAAGSRAAARLRRAGKLPGIVYGHKTDPVPVALDYHDVDLLLNHGAHLVNLEIDGEAKACLFKDTQYDYLGAALMHVDLARVDLTERVKVHVEIELRGTPKGVTEGGVLTAGLKELEVECLVTHIPETIRVDVSELDVDQVLHVKDLTLESGLSVLSDPESMVAMVREPAVKEVAAEEEVAEAAAGAGAEPEVIGKGKGEEEPGGSGD
ncbi:MAG: 50S ribosomal protein L25 [Phycisphaerae bacterium]|nr:50S ribosomal protein L25 [Phycisphaerae bacterium]